MDWVNEQTGECVGNRTIQWRTVSLWVVACQGLHHKPLTCANVANMRSARAVAGNLRINTRSPAFLHSSAPAAPFSPCIPHSHSFTDNPANEGVAIPGGVSSQDLKAPNLQTKASGQLGLISVVFFYFCCFFLLLFFLNHSGHVSFWTGNALKN